jgi:hypothetical protein
VLVMLNGLLIASATDVQKSDLLAALIDAPFFTDEQRIEILYLSTLSRPPDDEERTRLLKFVSTGNSEKALADVLWSLLNSSEFLLNH